MRFLRGLLSAAIVTTALVLPSTALAQVDSVSVSDARLGPDGTTLAVTAVVQCEPGWFLFGMFIDVTQVSGHKIARGSGSFFPSTSTSCPVTEVIPVSNFGAFAFKNGKATATATVGVSNPSTGGSVVQILTTEPFRIRK